MKKTIIYLAVLFSAILFAIPSGCYYDNEEDLYGTGQPCDTVSVSYSGFVLPLLQNHCYKCHKPSEPLFSGYVLEGYDATKAYATSGKISDRTNNVANPMPPLSEGGLLPDCDRQKILAWIRAGAPNN